MNHIICSIIVAVNLWGHEVADAPDGPPPRPVVIERPSAPDKSLAMARWPAFAVIYRPGPKWRAGVSFEKQGLRDHFLYLQALKNQGHLVIAGPLGVDGGLVVLRAGDQAKAEQLVAADPAVKAGLFSGNPVEFIPRLAQTGPINVAR